MHDYLGFNYAAKPNLKRSELIQKSEKLDKVWTKIFAAVAIFMFLAENSKSRWITNAHK